MNTNDSPNSAQAASVEIEGSIYDGIAACLIRDGKTIAHVVEYPDAVAIAAALVQFETTPGVDAPSGFVEVGTSGLSLPGRDALEPFLAIARNIGPNWDDAEWYDGEASDPPMLQAGQWRALLALSPPISGDATLSTVQDGSVREEVA